jgi:predicted RNA-binding Zn-ribbon protein involved in translation (DUF1610 family)
MEANEMDNTITKDLVCTNCGKAEAISYNWCDISLSINGWVEDHEAWYCPDCGKVIYEKSLNSSEEWYEVKKALDDLISAKCQANSARVVNRFNDNEEDIEKVQRVIDAAISKLRPLLMKL